MARRDTTTTVPPPEDKPVDWTTTVYVCIAAVPVIFLCCALWHKIRRTRKESKASQNDLEMNRLNRQWWSSGYLERADDQAGDQEDNQSATKTQAEPATAAAPETGFGSLQEARRNKVLRTLRLPINVSTDRTPSTAPRSKPAGLALPVIPRVSLTSVDFPIPEPTADVPRVAKEGPNVFRVQAAVEPRKEGPEVRKFYERNGIPEEERRASLVYGSPALSPPSTIPTHSATYISPVAPVNMPDRYKDIDDEINRIANMNISAPQPSKPKAKLVATRDATLKNPSRENHPLRYFSSEEVILARSALVAGTVDELVLPNDDRRGTRAAALIAAILDYDAFDTEAQREAWEASVKRKESAPAEKSRGNLDDDDDQYAQYNAQFPARKADSESPPDSDSPPESKSSPESKSKSKSKSTSSRSKHKSSSGSRPRSHSESKHRSSRSHSSSHRDGHRDRHGEHRRYRRDGHSRRRHSDAAPRSSRSRRHDDQDDWSKGLSSNTSLGVSILKAMGLGDKK